MSDLAAIPELLQLGGDAKSLQNAQNVAAQKLLAFNGEIFPKDACAITLSTLMQLAGVDVPDVYQAFALGKLLRDERNWAVIPVGQQASGDVGSTCGAVAHHLIDHIYLVLQVADGDEMLIADNQSSQPHFRWASGAGGTTPTKFFLRATA